MITRDDLTVTHDTSPWGAPTATVTVRGTSADGIDYEHTYTLRSSDGLKSLKRIGKEPAIHLFQVGGGDDWHGAFPTNNMGDAVNMLVEYLNEHADREAAEWATAGPLCHLREAVTAFDDALSTANRLHDWRQRWADVWDAVIAVEVALNSRTTFGAP